MLNISSVSAIALKDFKSSLLIKISIQSNLLHQIPRNVDPLKNSSMVTSFLLFTPGCQFLEKGCIIEEEIQQTVCSHFVPTYRPDTAQTICVRNHCSSSVRSIHYGRGAIKIWSSWPKHL